MKIKERVAKWQETIETLTMAIETLKTQMTALEAKPSLTPEQSQALETAQAKITELTEQLTEAKEELKELKTRMPSPVQPSNENEEDLPEAENQNKPPVERKHKFRWT